MFVISDLHLGHKNIIKYCNRPFDNVEDMNKTILKMFDKLPKGSTILNLGDIALGNIKMLPNYIERMKSNNKKLILVKGNHDKLEEEAYYKLGFDKVYSEPVYLKYCTLSHEPIENADRLNFHGHTHDKEPQDFNSVYNNNKFYVNCCLDYRKTFLEIADDILEGVL